MAQIYLHPAAYALHHVAALQRRTGLVALPEGRVVHMVSQDEWLAIRATWRDARRNAVAEHFGPRPGPGAA